MLELTKSQELKIIDNGFTLEDFNEMCDAIPLWCELESVYDLQSIIHSGCAGTAHYAVYYERAFNAYFEFEDEIEDILRDHDLHDQIRHDENETMKSYISKRLSASVECVACGFCDALADVDWD